MLDSSKVYKINHTVEHMFTTHVARRIVEYECEMLLTGFSSEIIIKKFSFEKSILTHVKLPHQNWQQLFLYLAVEFLSVEGSQ